MNDEKKPPGPSPLAKSYTVDGDTTEFNPWALQVHEISPELRRQISQLERPRLDPKCFQDTLPPNLAVRDAPPPAEPPAPAESSADANSTPQPTEPSLRVLVQNAAQHQRWRPQRTGVVALLGLGLVGAIGASLLLAERDGAVGPAPRDAGEPRAAVQRAKVARPDLTAVSAVRAGGLPSEAKKPMTGDERPVANAVSSSPGAASSPPRVVAGRGMTPTPRAPTPPPEPPPLPELEPAAPKEVSTSPHPVTSSTPSPVASSKSAFKFFLPPQ